MTRRFLIRGIDSTGAPVSAIARTSGHVGGLISYFTYLGWRALMVRAAVRGEF